MPNGTIKKFDNGITYALFGLATSYEIQASGLIYDVALGSLLALLYTAFSLKSDSKRMKRSGLPFTSGVFLVALVIEDPITILVCAYVCGVTILRVGHEYVVWPYVIASFVAFGNFLHFVYPYAKSLGFALKDRFGQIWDYLGRLVSKLRE